MKFCLQFIFGLNKKAHLLLFYSIIVLFFSCDTKDQPATYITNQEIDAANKDQLIEYFEAFKDSNIDSIILKRMLRILDKDDVRSDTQIFLEYNTTLRELAIKDNQISTVAETYWNSATYYLSANDYINAFQNYKKAYELYSSVNDTYYAAKMLYNMAFIQGRVKDYYGAESNLFKAIPAYRELNKNTSLYKCYNLLGTIYSENNNFESAIQYHTKSLELLSKIKKGTYFFEASSNDIGLVYQKQGNYSKSIQMFTQALASNIEQKNRLLFAKINDNLAYVRLLNNDTLGVFAQLNKSLAIRDSVQNESGIIISKLHLASYYAKKKDTAKAIILSKEANQISKKLNNNRDVLASYILLSKLDQQNSKNYLARYIALNDSIQKNDDAIKNKFARLRFETDDYISQNETLIAQRAKIFAISFIVIAFLTLLYFLRAQRQKTKLLMAEKENEEANKKVSRLIYEEQMALENGRLQARNRIAEELHDGVLGKLFGTRMKIGFIKVAEKDATELKENIVSLLDIEQDIRKLSHSLKSNISASKEDFAPIVENLLKEQSALVGYKHHFTSAKDIQWNNISEEQKIELFRIVQEALQNINKHAKANNVYIDFDIANENLVVIIKDDGIGFQPESKKNGIGIRNIKDRATRLNADLSIIAAPNEGTILKIVFLHKTTL